MSGFIESEESVYDHDDFEAQFDDASYDDCGSERSFDNASGAPYLPPVEGRQIDLDGDKIVVSATVLRPEESNSEIIQFPGVPKVVRRPPVSRNSDLSDISGFTELDAVVPSCRPEQGQPANVGARSVVATNTPRQHQPAPSNKNRVTVKKVKTYSKDGNFVERLQFSNGMETTMTRINAGDALPTLASTTTSSNSSRAQEIQNTEPSDVIDAPCVLASNEEYQHALARQAKTPMDPTGRGPARNKDATIAKHGDANEHDVNRIEPPESVNFVASHVRPASLDGSNSVSTRSDGRTRRITTTTTVVSAAESSLGSGSRPTREIRKTIRQIKEPVQDSGNASVSCLPERTMTMKNVIRKSTTFAADGSSVEKIVNADGTTTTTIKRSTKGTASVPESRLKSSRTSHSSASSSSNTGTARKKTLTKKHRKPHDTRSHRADSSPDTRIVKAHTTRQSSDGSRIEVTEFTDGSKVTRTLKSKRLS